MYPYSGYERMPPAEKLFAENLALKPELADLGAPVAWFQRQMFAGGRREKLLVETARQTKLALPEVPQGEQATQVITYERRSSPTSSSPNISIICRCIGRRRCLRSGMSAQWDAALSRKSMVDWVRIAANWAEPIYKLMLAELLSDR